METVEEMAASGRLGLIEPEQAIKNLIKALGKGVLKVMSKMGISTVASYRGAQIFEAIGLAPEVVDEYFTGTTSKLGGAGLDTPAEETPRRLLPRRPDLRAHRPGPRGRRRVLPRPHQQARRRRPGPPRRGDRPPAR